MLFSCHLHPPTWNTMCLNVTLNDGNNEITGYAYITEETGKNWRFCAVQLLAVLLHQRTLTCQLLSPTSLCEDLTLLRWKMRKSHYYYCWLEQLSLAVLSLPLTCGDISHQTGLKSGKYSGYSVLSLSNSMEIPLNSNGGRMWLGTAGFPCVSLFFHTSSSLAYQLPSFSSSYPSLCCLRLFLLVPSCTPPH